MFLRRRVSWLLVAGSALIGAAIPANAADIAPDGSVTLHLNFQVPPSAEDVAELQAQVGRAQMVLCDSTDAQIRLSKVRITVGDGSQEKADVLLIPVLGRSYVPGAADKVVMKPSHARATAGAPALVYQGQTLAHELGHFLFAPLKDSYREQFPFGSACGWGPSFDSDLVALADRSRRNSIMQVSTQVCTHGPTGMTLSEFNPTWPNEGCARDEDCRPIACPGCAGAPKPDEWFCGGPTQAPLFASEMSTQVTHDRRRTTIADRGWPEAVCPGATSLRPGNLLVLNANMDPGEQAIFPVPGQPGFLCGNGVVDDGEQCDMGRAGNTVFTRVTRYRCADFAVDVNPNGTCKRDLACTDFGIQDFVRFPSCSSNCTFNKVLCFQPGIPGNPTPQDLLVACEKVATTREACVFDGTNPVPPSGAVCSSVAGGLTAGSLSCHTFNCTLDASQCAGRLRPPVVTDTFGTAAATAQASATVQLMDAKGLARSSSPKAATSLHELGLHLIRLSQDDWLLYVLGRGEEYVGGTTNKAVAIRTMKLGFNGLVVDRIDGAPITGPVTLVVGQGDPQNANNGAFKNGAPPATLTLQLDGARREKWLTPRDGSTASGTTTFRPGTGVLWVQNGSPPGDQVGLCEEQIECKNGWNAATGRFEATSETYQGLRDGNPPTEISDWDTVRVAMTAKGVKLEVPPTGLPAADTPSLAACGGAIAFPAVSATGLDQTILVIDRSASMGTKATPQTSSELPLLSRAKAGLPDRFGGLLERLRGLSEKPLDRLDQAKAAARGYLDLQTLRGHKVGLVSFAGQVTQDQVLAQVIPAAPVGADQVLKETVRQKIDALALGSGTNLGTALATARQSLATADASRARTIVLISDGGDPIHGVSSGTPSFIRRLLLNLLGILETNMGPDPLVVADVLAKEGIVVHTINVGQAAGRQLLANIAAKTGGRTLDLPETDLIPAALMAMFAQGRGETPIIDGAPSAVEKVESFLQTCYPDTETPCGPYDDAFDTGHGCFCLAESDAIPAGGQQESFEIPVEAGADRLNVLLAAAQPDPSKWNPRFRLIDPSGATTVTDASATVVVDPVYRLVSVPVPAQGKWRLEIEARDVAVPLFSHVSAHVENSHPDLLSGSPVTVKDGTDTEVSFSPQFDWQHIMTGATCSAALHTPDGKDRPLAVAADASRPGALFARVTADSYVGRGVYRVDALCRVEDDARPLPGEALGPELPADAPPDIKAFDRHVRRSFYVDSTVPPPVTGVGDCDGNGVPDEQEAAGDTDFDGLPDVCDDDDDNDDVPDARDGAPKNAGCQVASGCPVADAGPDQLLECVSDGSAPATLDGRRSSNPQGGALTYVWSAEPVVLTKATTAVATGRFSLGTTTATLVAGNATGRAGDTVNLTVMDTRPPRLMAPRDITISSCVTADIGTATASDACGGAVTIISNAAPKFEVGVTVVTWRAVDRFGNVATASQRVTVELGDDPSCCPAGSHVVVGTPRNDVLIGTPGDDCILGGGGNDVLIGEGGNDFLSGGAGNDLLSGGKGNDILRGGPGFNLLEGGEGDDTLVGGDDRDVLHGDGGNDRLFCGGGDDICLGGTEDDVIAGGGGRDLLGGGTGNDQIQGDDGDDVILGGAGDDRLDGGRGTDICVGAPGKDTLVACEKFTCSPELAQAAR